MKSRVLLFYPYFPTYRRGILNSLADSEAARVTIVAGTKGRASIDVLTSHEVPGLQETRTWRLGPVSWHPEAVRRALGSEFDAVVMSPATLSASVWAVLIIRRLRRQNTYLWGQCGEPGARNLKRWVQEIMNRCASGLLVYANSARDAACELGTNRTKVAVVGNAVEHHVSIDTLTTEEVKRLADNRGIGVEPTGKPIHLLYIGRVTPGKKLERLVAAIRLLRERGHEVSASIVGGGSSLPELTDLVQSSGMPIDTPGPLYTDDELSLYFEKATVAVAPHSIGLLALDAIRHAVPVVYPINPVNGPEFEALTLGTNAICFENLTAEGLADAVEHWLALAPRISKKDFEAATREAVRNWTPERVAARILKRVTESLPTGPRENENT